VNWVLEPSSPNEARRRQVQRSHKLSVVVPRKTYSSTCLSISRESPVAVVNN